MKLGFLVSAVPSKCIFSGINLFFFLLLRFRCAEKRRYFEEMATIVCSCCKLEDHPDGASFCLLKLQSH